MRKCNNKMKETQISKPLMLKLVRNWKIWKES